MRDKVTADDIVSAVEEMEERKRNWEANHPYVEMKVCPLCKNTGLVRRAYDEYGTELFGEDMNKAGAYDYFYPCKCVTLQHSRMKKSNEAFSNVPLLYKDAMLDNFSSTIYNKIDSKELATMAKKKVGDYIRCFDEMEKVGMGLFIYSEKKGCGKTRLASSVANELKERGIRVKFESANKILSEIQRAWNDKNVSESSIIEKYINPRVLIVDDFGARSGKDWMDEKFLMIIDARYQDRKVTIFTSNYTLENLPVDDERITDRLSDVDRFEAIKMPNESVRIKARLTSGKVSLFNQITRGAQE